MGDLISIVGAVLLITIIMGCIVLGVMLGCAAWIMIRVVRKIRKDFS